MKRSTPLFFAAILSLGSALAQADPVKLENLKLKADPRTITLSGVSSGAAMAVQYAVANSATVAGVGAIAGPPWGCAGGVFSHAVKGCMCGTEPISFGADNVKKEIENAGKDLFDQMDPTTGRPVTLKRAFVFHSAADKTVVADSGVEAVKFLHDFIGAPPKEDWGNSADGSDQAGHGILARDAKEPCGLDRHEKKFIRNCKGHDNAGDVFKALYGPLSPEAERQGVTKKKARLRSFDQRPFIRAVKSSSPMPIVAMDDYLMGLRHTDRRLNFDLADNGYIYIPKNCGPGKPQCRVHVALHGCKQNPHTFAQEAGYNYWAEKYDVIVVYPAVKAYQPFEVDERLICEESKTWPPYQWKSYDAIWAEANYNGCWDWWGYLDSGNELLEGTKTRYLTKQGPQIMFLQKVIQAVAPLAK